MAEGYAGFYGRDSSQAVASWRRLVDLLLRSGRWEEAVSRQEQLGAALKTASDKTEACCQLDRLCGILYALLNREIGSGAEAVGEDNLEYLENLSQTCRELVQMAGELPGRRTSMGPKGCLTFFWHCQNRKKNLEKSGWTGFVRHFASCQAFTAKRTGRL